MLEIKNVTKKYNDIRKKYDDPTGKYRPKTALNDVSLTIGQGEIVGLFGENGAGKTTLMKCILNLLKYKGDILLDGEKITRKNAARFSFATCEHSFFPGLDAKGHKQFYMDEFEGFREKRFDALMDFFSLPPDKKIRTLSTGQQNQFEVIMALCQGADYILMDEPFAGNDIFNREDFYKVLLGILEENETVFLSTHLIEEVSGFVGRAVLLKDGEIIGDVGMDELGEKGVSLTGYIKEKYHYEYDRVGKAIEHMAEGEE
ncbi:MAG: ABC transporter ATP-binding protein [Eubacterium sp.]|nr:ABC transporter ATP-binding protein [Eubacterium sp.]